MIVLNYGSQYISWHYVYAFEMAYGSDTDGGFCNKSCFA